MCIRDRPLKYGLLFERFLNKGRKELPDIDMDFDERYRNDVIDYVVEKYGQDKVAHIVTFATIKAKQAIRDSSRVLGLPFSAGDKSSQAYATNDFGKYSNPIRMSFFRRR